MDRRICIHGHFYQPPRENPWLEEIEVQDSAYPYHDWNERITDECYARNGASRILDREKRIIDIMNNYARISFNFGPTLLSWMQDHESEVYDAVLEADREGMERFAGHGPAMAQCYNHMIMPLANTRDKKTQVRWGIRDFEHRFKRKPEGMWLPETAVDLETLDIMAKEGIRFTILAPYQATAVREPNGQWNEVIDTRRPYLCHLPSGRSITIFFYDGPISHDVAFREVLKSGEAFSGRLTGAFANRAGPQLVHIATDGETYGHHHRFGEMALSYCLFLIESQDQAEITVYGKYLEDDPPEREVEIKENTSWSCTHGIDRWKCDCGCSTGAHPGWHQKWRAPLREAMDLLRDGLAPLYEREMAGLVKDPWGARDDYIDAILDRSEENVKRFLADHTSRDLSPEDEIKVLKLLEMQRHTMLMYTSCGWFFDDITGIETIQVIQYAARAIQLAREVTGEDLEPAFLDILKGAPSNLEEEWDGSMIYEKNVRPAIVDPVRVGAHYAISSLFEDHPEAIKIGMYHARKEDYERRVAGIQKLAVGRVWIRSEITWEEETICFAVLHLGGHNIMGGIHGNHDGENPASTQNKITDAFSRGDIPEVIRILDRHYGTHSYSLWHLFKDQQRKVLNHLLDSTLQEVETSFRQIYEHHYPIMNAMIGVEAPLPKALAVPAEFILNKDLTRLLGKEVPRVEALQEIAQEFARWNFEPDRTALEYAASQKINDLLKKLGKGPEDLPIMESLDGLFQMVISLGLHPDLWKSQNTYFAIAKKQFPGVAERVGQGDQWAKTWLDLFHSLGKYLEVKSP